MTLKFDAKLILIFLCVSFGIFLFPATTKGGCSATFTPTCGSHYGIICADKEATWMTARGICMSWQTPSFITACSPKSGWCVDSFSGCLINQVCAKPPENLRHYDNPSYPTTPFVPEEGMDAENVFLPVKLSWDNIEGWKDGWVDNNAKNCFRTCQSSRGTVENCTKQCSVSSLKICQDKCDEIGRVKVFLGCGASCDADYAPRRCYCIAEAWRNQCKLSCPNTIKNGFNFYQIKIEGKLKDPLTLATTTEYTNFLTKPEFLPSPCFFERGETYSWKVRACSSENESTCGTWSDQKTFTTRLTPEPVSPLDPDWAGPGKGQNITLPTTLDWCDVDQAGSYRLQLYEIKNGEKTCHPQLLSIKEGSEACDSWLLRKTRRDQEQVDKILYSDFPDENMDFFTKDTIYSWQVAACDADGFNCGDYSQLWTFTSAEKTLETSLLTSPTNDPEGKIPVGLPLILNWSDKPGVNSFVYELTSVSGNLIFTGNTQVSQSKSFDFPQLSLNTAYKWRVKSCWDYESQECELDFSEEWYFKTTGEPPRLTYPAPSGQNIVIPVSFTWENVSGAKSYILKVNGNGLSLEKISDKPEFSLDFPEYPISQETDYSWQVKTCAWDKGQTCELYSSAQSFKTFRLPPPQKSTPSNSGQLFTGDKYVSWENVSGAKAYQYQIRLVSLSEKEIDETCPALVGKDLFEQSKTSLANSDFVELKCLGQYQWQVRSCLDGDCKETSNWSGPWSFALVQGGTGQNGLVPCGRSTDDPKTPWNERELCQIKHLFLLVKIIIDFLLFRAIPTILVLLTIATALIFYTSLGQRETMSQAITLWKVTGWGLIIIFFAWIIVNIFLKLIGYQVGIFGNWYQLTL